MFCEKTNMSEVEPIIQCIKLFSDPKLLPSAGRISCPCRQDTFPCGCTFQSRINKESETQTLAEIWYKTEKLDCMISPASPWSMLSYSSEPLWQTWAHLSSLVWYKWFYDTTRKLICADFSWWGRYSVMHFANSIKTSCINSVISPHF